MKGFFVKEQSAEKRKITRKKITGHLKNLITDKKKIKTVNKK